MILPSDETELSTKDRPEENSLSTKESFTGKIGVTIGDLDKYKKDSLINIWKDANAYYSSGEEWTDEDAEFFDELAVRINTATEEGMASVSGPAVGMVANNHEDETMIMPPESLDQITLNENYIQDQFGIFYRPVYVGENYKEHESDLVFEGKLYTNEGVGNCPFCKGAGKITVEKLGLKDCPDCDGTGDLQQQPQEIPQEVPVEEEPTDVFGTISPKPKKEPKKELKEHYDKDGTYWFTTDGGRKIGVKKGQTLEDALSDAGIPDDGTDQSDVTAEDMAKNEDKSKDKPKKKNNTEEDKNELDRAGILDYLKDGIKSEGDILSSADISADDDIYDIFEQLEAEGKIESVYDDDDKLQEFPSYKLTKNNEEDDSSKKVWGNDEDMIDDIPKEDKKADGKTSMGMKDIDIRDRNIGMSSNDEGGLDLSLDQDGWSWSGDETDLIDYINRVATSSKSDEFLEQLKDVPFDKLKEQMVKNIDDNPDAFYSLSGDSRRWKFGETEDGDMSYMIDEEITQAEEELTDEQIQKVSDDVWDNYDGGSYEEFMESWHGKELKGQFTKALEESDSLEELFEQFTQDTGLRYDSIVAQSGYDDDLKYNAIRETIQNVLGKKDSGESKASEDITFGDSDDLKNKVVIRVRTTGIFSHERGRWGSRYSGLDQSNMDEVMNSVANKYNATSIRSIGGSGDGKYSSGVTAITIPREYEYQFISDINSSQNQGDDSSMKASVEEYITESLNTVCPECGSKNTSRQKTKFGGGQAPERFDCKKCGNVFKPKSTESCGCKTKGLEASISKYEKFIKTEINVLKTRAKAGEAVGLMYGLPTVRKNGKKIKGTLAYAGVSLNDRIYLPEELAKGHGKTLPLLLNHSSTAGAEEEMDRLDGEMRNHLENEKDYEVGEVTLTWDADKLTLFYEGVIENEFFQKEVDDMDMAVSLGIFYDSNSPKVCDEECYTLIKGAEFREVSLVYHAGFPIATIEAVESKLKRASIKDIKAKANEDSLIKVEDKNDDNTKVTVLDEWKSKGEAIAEEEDELPRGGSIDAEPKETDVVEQPVVVDLETSNEVRSQSDFSVRGVSGMTISNSNGVEKYSFDPTQNYSTNTIHFSVTEKGGTIFGEEIQMQPKMTTPDELTKEIESKPNVKFTDADEDILKKN